jgi:hypothetical protein
MQAVYMHSSIKSILPAWVYCLILVAACGVLYLHTTSYGYTELDDSIFIREFEQYNKQDSSYVHSFRRGVFSETSDTYYRPLLLASFVFDRHREGKLQSTLHSESAATDSISTYHLSNVLLHGIAVLLLFFLLRLMRCNNSVAFVIAVIFAVHPALVQAVAWIPGRNDSLLAVWIFSFMLSAFAAAEKHRVPLYVVQFLCLLAAFFTKETAVIAAPMALFILVSFHGLPLRGCHRSVVGSARKSNRTQSRYSNTSSAWRVCGKIAADTAVPGEDTSTLQPCSGALSRSNHDMVWCGCIGFDSNSHSVVAREAMAPHNHRCSMVYRVPAACAYCS